MKPATPTKRRGLPKSPPSPPLAPEQLMTAKAAAAATALSIRHVRRLIANGTLPAIRLGRAVRVRVRDVRDLTRPE